MVKTIILCTDNRCFVSTNNNEIAELLRQNLQKNKVNAEMLMDTWAENGRGIFTYGLQKGSITIDLPQIVPFNPDDCTSDDVNNIFHHIWEYVEPNMVK